MGHAVTFENPGHFAGVVTTQELEDVVNFFYRWKDTRFRIVGKDERPGLRGHHIYVHHERTHVITLSMRAIRRGVFQKSRMGGNGPAPNLRVGTVMVLVHELQHANQAGQHLSSEKFYTHRDYNTRPCEREARTFVDSHMREIMTLVSPELLEVFVPGTAMAADGDGLTDVLDAFEGIEELSLADLKDELRRSGLNTPKNTQEARSLLAARGVRIF